MRRASVNDRSPLGIAGSVRSPLGPDHREPVVAVEVGRVRDPELRIRDVRRWADALRGRPCVGLLTVQVASA
jgi:hypothetical protein